jgi:hypothetical protein
LLIEIGIIVSISRDLRTRMSVIRRKY